MIENVWWYSCKVPFILVRFKLNLNFLDRFSKNTQIPNVMKIRPVGTELFHADRRTDKMKLIVAFRNFANAPKTRSISAHNTGMHNFYQETDVCSSLLVFLQNFAKAFACHLCATTFAGLRLMRGRWAADLLTQSASKLRQREVSLAHSPRSSFAQCSTNSASSMFKFISGTMCNFARESSLVEDCYVSFTQ